LNVTIIERAPVQVAYLRHVGPYGDAVAAFWQRQFQPYMARHGLLERPIYGISHDDPHITEPAKCRYDACVEVDAQHVAGHGALLTQIPAGRYASLPFRGTPATIGAAWTALLREWLPASGYQLDGRPTFEYYPPGAAYDQASGSFECDIVIPLARP
jgi:AraC family transcriptional regulator